MKEYIQKNEERFLEELFEILRIPSISSLEANKGDMVTCANKLVELLLAAGANPSIQACGYSPMQLASALRNPACRHSLLSSYS